MVRGFMVVKPPFPVRRRNCVSLTHIIAVAYDGKDFTACLRAFTHRQAQKERREKLNEKGYM